MANKNFLDWSTFTDPSAGRELLNNSIRKGLTFDAYGTKKRFKFKARVLTNASYLTADGEAAINRDPPTSDEAAGSIANTTFKSFRYQARITGSNSPHAFLPDPCSATYAEKPVEAFRLIAMHTTFVSTFDLGANATAARLPVAGQIVEVELESSGQLFDLQTGFHVGIVKRELPSEQKESFCKAGEFFEHQTGEARSLSEEQQARNSTTPNAPYTSAERTAYCKEYATLEECAKAGNFYGPPLSSIVAPVIGYQSNRGRQVGLTKCSNAEQALYRALSPSLQGVTGSKGGFVMPVSGFITSEYGDEDIAAHTGGHRGLDISAPNYSSPGVSAGGNSRRDDGSSAGEYKDEHYFMGAIIAPQAGTIKWVTNPSPKAGAPGDPMAYRASAVYLECPTSPPTRFIFYHLDSHAKGIAQNVMVSQGQVLGRIGTTGPTVPAIGPHLHIEVYTDEGESLEGAGKKFPDAPTATSPWKRQDPMEYCGWAAACGRKTRLTNLYRGFGCGASNYGGRIVDEETGEVISEAGAGGAALASEIERTLGTERGTAGGAGYGTAGTSQTG
jgi:murein DD-endopeptidase MepM/ murein hydrolase activator NlpD